MFRLAIAGGGIGGSALISLLRGDPNTNIVGLYEQKQEAPAVVLARKWGIPVFGDVRHSPPPIPRSSSNVSGDPNVSSEYQAELKNRTDVIEGIGARFLWEIIEKQKRAKIEAVKTAADQKIVYNLPPSSALRIFLQTFMRQFGKVARLLMPCRQYVPP